MASRYDGRGEMASGNRGKNLSPFSIDDALSSLQGHAHANLFRLDGVPRRIDAGISLSPVTLRIAAWIVAKRSSVIIEQKSHLLTSGKGGQRKGGFRRVGD